MLYKSVIIDLENKKERGREMKERLKERGIKKIEGWLEHPDHPNVFYKIYHLTDGAIWHCLWDVEKDIEIWEEIQPPPRKKK